MQRLTQGENELAAGAYEIYKKHLDYKEKSSISSGIIKKAIDTDIIVLFLLTQTTFHSNF